LVAPARRSVHSRRFFFRRDASQQISCLAPLNLSRFPSDKRTIGGEVALESDEDLFRRIRAGDNLALQTLYGRHHVKVFRFAMRLLRNEQSAEDIVSEVFIDVWRNPNGFEGKSQAATWLLAITRNKAYSLLRKKKEDQIDEDAASEIEDEADDPEVVMQKATKGDLLRACIARLSVEHREVIDLVYYHDKSVEEVALIVGAPEGTVKTRMFHARKKLSELAQAAGIDRGWP
jgi:RNA polymerase sigma-70 factor (ECF subfamily)